ncbi:MAG: 4Fe-4S binding protein [Deltaproteobacteria bacterium]|jgi:pyruvate ferredoxin oxidoreductase delta subunit|nr:4Fe-4S binding protein [Deltaproteobacteria bacterium]
MTKPAVEAIAKVGDLPLGFIGRPKRSRAAKTGDWRSVRPVLDRARCNYCGFCYFYCPDGVFQDMGEEKYYQADLDYCKGCGICAHECPKKAIAMIQEEV